MNDLRAVDLDCLKWMLRDRGSELCCELWWLRQKAPSANNIVSFGCSPRSNEPFVLLWVLNASKVTVIEIENTPVEQARARWEELKKREPQHTKGRNVEFIPKDMRTVALPVNCFDLAFCQDVLYWIGDDHGRSAVQSAIETMANTVRPAGWIIAVEPKLRKALKKDDSTAQASELGAIHALFKSAGLLRHDLSNCPDDSYCYLKPDEFS